MAEPDPEAVRALQDALGPEMAVFSSGRRGGATVTVIQLAGEAEVAAVRPAVDRLVAEFRELAGALVARLRVLEPLWDDDEDPACPDEIELHGSTWSVSPHDPHYRFENEASGEVVEAQMYDPDRLDPYFLETYARTSGRHPAVVDVCRAPFHDMCRLLDAGGIPYG
ncbi:hypothetical protein [Actinoplanes sp. NPDC049265]|uniref:hypothetical protein n=1 Tax=Actinoplanes sp. NPDC049265 TaxID=3363902 RepID=UPI00371A302A